MKTFFAAIAALLIATAAHATPILSGHYSLNIYVVCQAKPDASPAYQGNVFTKLIDANFNPATGIVTVTGYESYADLVVASGAAGGVTVIPISYTSPYTNTDTTLTADGVTWHILYGPLTAGGIARSYETNGTADVGGATVCIGSNTGIRMQ